MKGKFKTIKGIRGHGLGRRLPINVKANIWAQIQGDVRRGAENL